MAYVAATDAMTRRHLRPLGCGVHRQEATQAVDWARRHLPDLIVWAGPDGDLPPGFGLHPATWNIPLVHLVRPPSRAAGLRVEADARLDHSDEADFAGAIRRAVAARDARLADGVVAELRLSLPSDLDELGRLGSLMGDWFARCGLKAFQNHQTTLALRELAANAIEWGHRHERERRVEVCAWLEADRVGILVRDSGPGFDRDRREGGFGIPTARACVDYLCYNDKGNEGMRVKFLPRPTLAAPDAMAS